MDHVEPPLFADVDPYLWSTPDSRWDTPLGFVENVLPCPTGSLVAPTGTDMQASTNRQPDPPADVVDLAPLSAACRDLVAWYDELIAGERPPIARLDQVITTLQALPTVGGRIGRDIDLIVNGGAHHTHDEIIGAVERLRTLANHQPDEAASSHQQPPRQTQRSKRRNRPTTQAPLPGLGLAGEGGLQ